MRTTKKWSFIFVFLSWIPFHLNGQINFTRTNEYLVLSNDGDTLDHPWAGGFNSVQFSEIDLNLDGIKDLFVFDRAGNKISTFLNTGTPNTVAYQHAPQYAANFPSGLHHWVLLRDYNCDGKMDIFGYSTGGMAVYQNNSTTSLSFTLVTNLLLSNFLPNTVNLFISSADIPAIDDVDSDGDLDVLTFSILGSRVEYHRNLSMENYGTCDSLTFELSNKCWGYFSENATNNGVKLFDTCNFNVPNPKGNKHAGSTLLTMDVDDNGTKDLILGDISFNNLTLLTNSDPSLDFTSSTITAQDSLFPKNNANTLATNLPIFPAGFYLDVNNDQKKDLIVSTNCFNGCRNNANVWFYQNNNPDSQPDFNLITESFLQNEMIEVGEGAHPVFFDYNADGLLDIVIGNHINFNAATVTNAKSSLFLYKNIGTTTTPAYQLITDDYANVATLNLDVTANQPTKGLAPTFGDIDGDGDKDMILGDFNGKIHLFSNSAGAGNTASFSLTNVDYMGIDVGNFATPQLIDVNKDLLLDLVIGKRNGYFSYYENNGSAVAPSFTLVTDSFGQVNTKRYNEFNGYSSPFMVSDNRNYKLFSGSNSGWIYEFDNIDGNLNGTFTLTDSAYIDIWEGSRSFINITDANDDGKLDLLIGNYSGGIAFYKGGIPNSLTEKTESLSNITIYPNPTKDELTIDVGTHPLKNATIEIIDLLGKTIYKQPVNQQKSILNMTPFNNGLYLIKFSNSAGNKVLKVMKK